jgi:hypothetical protein
VLHISRDQFATAVKEFDFCGLLESFGNRSCRSSRSSKIGVPGAWILSQTGKTG